MKIKSPLFPVFIVLLSFFFKIYAGIFYEYVSLFSDDYLNKYFFKTVINVLFSSIYLIYIFRSEIKNKLEFSSRSKFKFNLIALPLFYAALINLAFFEFEGEVKLQYIFSLLFYTLSVGLVEELSLRGIIQTQLVEFYGKHNRGAIKAIIVTSLAFAALHLLNFEKGLWGEIAQFSYALFIGLAFGSVLYITKRIYPLIIIHATIDFVGGLDRMGITNYSPDLDDWKNGLVIILLLSPYLVYSIYLFKQIKTSTQ